MHNGTILITGATSGIGHALTIALAKEWQIIALGREAAKLRNLAKMVHAEGGTCKTYRGDLASSRSIASVTHRIKKNHPQLDWIINNAGAIEADGGILGPSEKTFRQILQVNLIAPYHLLQSLWPLLQKGRGGIVNISSTAGLRGNPKFPAYSASKAGLISLSESLVGNALFQENRKYVVNLVPGATNTPMRDRIANDAAKQQPTQVITQWLYETLKNDAALQQVQGKRIIIKNSQISIE